ncbi:MAG: benenodin family lasso peptide [Sphingorhabdus sp.]
MENLKFVEEDVIDLGQASAETKGTALFLIDDDGGPRVYAAGIVAD